LIDPERRRNRNGFALPDLTDDDLTSSQYEVTPPPTALPNLSSANDTTMAPPSYSGPAATSLPMPDDWANNPTNPDQTRYSQLQNAKDVYMQGTPDRFKSGILGALRGFAQGAASGGGLAGALAGAATGGAVGAINPRLQRQAQFNESVMPKI